MENIEQLTLGTAHSSTPAMAAGLRTVTSRYLVLRIGAWSGVAGSLLALVANALHPHPTNYQLETLLATIANSSIWGVLHLTLIIALVLVFVALTAMTLSMDSEPALTLSRIACVVTLLGGALILVSTAIDGFAMNQLAHDWVNAAAAEKADALRTAAALENAQYAIYSLSIVLFLGIGVFLYGLASLLGGGYPKVLGWLAMLAGGGELVIGIVQALAGPAYRGTELPDALFSVLITLWLLMVAILMGRRSRVRHTPRYQVDPR